MFVPDISDVVARRLLILGGEPPRNVVVLVGKPKPLPNSEDCYCAYQIIGIGDEKVRYAAGIDSVQALQLTLRAVGAHLYLSAEGRSGTLKWEDGGSGDLGFPRPD